ncbi:type II toxin-antitoxin system RelE family toxin [Rothia aerolata]|uniref:Translation repressor RelE n=1 Tax=Rothia aerolata TaxID=1812262 RepID=A0A917IQD0_9MICC|nr:type II toxin-antitoxin system RelE/ParE family toxin [Rothia aerolata]GGH59626.1 translation repressor RelE [Rothia aerolata]
MSYTVVLTNPAKKQIRKLPRSVQEQIIFMLEGLSEDPRPYHSTKLVGHQTAWRIKVGQYRVIYDIFDAELVVSVVRAAHRREVYR